MDPFCPLVEGSADTAHERLTLGAILRAFLPALLLVLKLGKHKLRCFGTLPPVERRPWAPTFSLVPTLRIDTGPRAPAVTAIVRAAYRQKLAMAGKTDTESLTDHLLPLRFHSTSRT